MGALQRGLFLLGGVLIIFAILVEFGSMAVLGQTGSAAGIPAGMPRPGIGIPYLAVLDLLLLYTLLFFAVDFLPPLRPLVARVQGMVTLVLSLLGLIAMIVMIFLALQLLLLMVSLLVAVPFGTILYLAVWGHFDTHDAAVLLSAVMSLKLSAIVLLLISRPLFLKNIGFMLMIGTSMLCTLVLEILQSWFPFFLVSITDALGGLVIGILTAVWLVVFLIGSLPAILNAIRSVVSS